MRFLTLTIVSISLVSLSATFAFIGVDITGHVIPFVGIGMNTADDFLYVSLGVTFDASGTWGVVQGVGFFHQFRTDYGILEAGVSFKTLMVSEASEFLYLAGIGLGYGLPVGPVVVDIVMDAYYSMPFGATEEFKGPIPFIGLTLRQDTSH